ncbi:MAG: hypothetical protein ACOYL4_02420 [Miltoncostaeaceae bacterium]
MEAHVELMQAEDIIWTGHPTWKGTVCFSGVADPHGIAARIQPHLAGYRLVETP